MIQPGPQRTLAAPISVHGIGYWSDRDITVTFMPAEPDSGLVFVREDLPGKPRIPVRPEYRIAIPRRTSLEKNGARVEMVEHVLSALKGMNVDNCEIRVTAVEMPGLDGSAADFVTAFDSVGYEEQNVPQKQWLVTEAFTQKDPDPTRSRFVSAAPAEELQISFDIRYGQKSPIGNQTAQITLSPEVYRNEIAPCRTFVTRQEADAILKAGLAKRATYQDLLVFGENGPIENTLRFPNECARHKLLDIIGDLALLQGRLFANVRAFCSGHDLNALFVKQILERLV
ncbi:MAG: UDP-3-O-[3-hydroxymyristoyl] N-acetylglucosamine deacetylase [Planctomycetaceae bacterium]|nr:UDP-3-O-[3-hydroxymyristoyl] N-acetylglucosamine deacetylase [Planctomycetaceae bacterium]MBQ2822011.1 UDP-3-O-[3-hydroxymyristoyl] N-acetylglucosamine deacetylase [Thermoguttaceae bacterium]